MSEFKKLFQAKRILALVLALAMAVTMLPTTAYAAPSAGDGPEEQEAVTNPVSDDAVVTVNQTDDATDNQTEDDEDAAENSADTSLPVEAGEDTISQEQPKEAETDADNDADSEDAGDTDAGKNDIPVQVENEKDVYEIVDNNSSSDKTAEYNGDTRFKNDYDILRNIVIRKNDDDSYATLYDYQNRDDLSALTTKWVKKDSTDEVEPVEVGSYQLIITIPKSDNTDGTEKKIDFEITKQVLSVNVGTVYVAPGTKAADISYQASVYDSEYLFYAAYDTEAPDANKESKLVVTAKVKNAITNEEVGNDVELVKNGDYAVTLSFAFTDKATEDDKKRFEMPENQVVDISMTNLIATRIEWDYTEAYKAAHGVPTKDADGNVVKDADGKVVYESIEPFTYTYTGDAQEPVEGTDYEASVYTANPTGVDKDGNPTYTKLEGELTKVWSNTEEAPVNAGDYSFQLYYEGKEGVYAPSSSNYSSSEYGFSYIPVSIKPITLEIVPVIENDIKEFKAGTTAREVLAKVDYQVYKYDEKAVATDGLGERFDNTDKFNKDTFWGTYASYSGTEVSQSYQPVFAVCREVEVSTGEQDDAGKEITETEYVPLDDDDTLNTEETYHVVFTGEKAVSTASGSWLYREDINNYDWDWDEDGVNLTNPDSLNYAVDEEYAYSHKLTVTVAAAVEIDVTAITPIEKAYDGKPLYTDRADYKKAVVKKDGSTIASRTDGSLTYTWYYQSGTTTEYEKDENGNYKYDADGNLIIKSEKPIWRSLGTSARPVAVNTYRLLVSYDDKTHQNASAEAEVIYEITPREIQVNPAGDYEAYTGVTVGQFLRMTEVAYDITPVEEGVTIDELNDWEKDVDIDEYYEHDYNIFWCVEKQSEGGDWLPLASDYTFAEGDKIRLAVDDFEYHDSNYIDYKVEKTTAADGTTSEKRVYFHGTKDITLNKMGAAELTVTTDLTKLTEKSKVYNGEAFDISDALAGGLIKITAGTTDVTETVLPQMDGFWVEGTGEWPQYVEKPIDAGTYRYYLGFGGNEDYKAFEEEWASDDCTYFNLVHKTDITYEIKQAELTVTPSVKEEVVAGTIGHYAYNVNETVFETPVERDKEAFIYKRYEKEGSYYYGYEAVSGAVSFEVLDTEGNDASYAKLKGLETYTVKFADAELNGEYNRNYTLKAGESKTFTIIRSKSVVTASNPENNNALRVSDDVSKPTEENGYTYIHTITMQEAIPYSYSLYDRDASEYKDGSYLAVRVTIPAEYSSNSINPMYENSIKSAGGFNLTRQSNYIQAVFDAKEAAKKEFDIRWEDGFVEHFVLDFTNAEFAADFRAAVAPKTLAFNNAGKKMVVGGTQQLDVKLSKSQEGDIIHLSYKVDKEDVLCVTDGGYVTALSKGSATVTVYSSKLAIGEDGEETWVETTPVKKATVKITINNVTTPKIKSVTAQDNKITVSWAAEIDGYRSEIYVLPGKNVPAGEFEDKIASLKMQEYAWQNVFAIAPVYVSKYTYNTNTKTKLYNQTLSNLSPRETYTIYVRNVSEIRKLNCDHGDGCQVSESHAGSVKSFTTTKSQLTGLRFDEEKISESVTSYDEDKLCYTIALSKGSLAMPLEGLFRERMEYDAADGDDSIWKDLPLSKADQKNYAAPKLVYYVGEARDTAHSIGDGCMNSTGVGMSFRYYDKDGFHWAHLYNTSLATIKNGKLTLKGVGKVAVVALDTNTGNHAVAFVDITANADGIKGKSVKMQIGQSVSLYDMVTYSEGKKALTGSFEKSIVVDDALKEVFAKDDRFELNGVMVTAVQAGKGMLNFKVTDSVVNSNRGTPVEAAVKLSVTALDPVKNLKTTFVTDRYADLEFSYAGYAEAFRIQVTDARGNILQSKYVPKNSSIYNEYTGKYVYRIGNLIQKSKYNVAITALYGDIVSKTVKKSFTTTPLPASYLKLDDSIKYDSDYTGGVPVLAPYVSDDDDMDTYVRYFQSGNTYTLAIDENDDDFNKGAKLAKTDTLTWSSTNKKVATVKANAGSYTAALKAVGQGSTYIEIRSKVTKAVIARCRVYVYAVGDANGYYGDYEKLVSGTIGGSNPSETQVNPTPVSFNQSTSSVKLVKGSYKWYSFTANSAGTYTFVSNNDSAYAWFFYDTNQSVINGIGYNADSDILDSKCSEYAKLTSWSGKQLRLAADETVYFALGSDKLADEISSVCVDVVNDGDEPDFGDNTGIRPVSTTPTNLYEGYSAYVSVAANQFQWVRFTAPEAGKYWFYSERYDTDPKAWFFNVNGKNYVENHTISDTYDLNNWSNTYGYGWDDDGDGADSPSVGNNNFSKIITLSAGETVYIAVGEYDLNEALSAGVYVEKVAESEEPEPEEPEPEEPLPTLTLTVGSSVAVSVAANQYQWIEFTADENANYRFYSDNQDFGDPYAWFFNQSGKNYVGNESNSSNLYSISESDLYGYGSNDDSNGNLNFSKALTLSEGDTIYIAVGNNELGHSMAATVHVEILPPQIPEEISVVGEDGTFTNINLSSGYKWLKFETPMAGTYEFRVDISDSSNRIWLLSQTGYETVGDCSSVSALNNYSNKSNGGYGNLAAQTTGEKGFPVYLEKDAVVYLAVGNALLSSGCNIDVKVLNTQKEVKVDETGVSVSVTSSNPQIFSFTAPESREYAFKITNDNSDNSLTAALYKDDALIEEIIAFTSDFDKLKSYLEEDETVYLKVINGNANPVDVTVKVEPVIEELTDENVGGIEVSAHSVKWFSYTIPAKSNEDSENNDSDTESEVQYQFTFTVDKESVAVWVYSSDEDAEGEEIGFTLQNENGDEEDNENTSYIGTSATLVKVGDKVLIKVDNSADDTAHVKVALKESNDDSDDDSSNSQEGGN